MKCPDCGADSSRELVVEVPGVYDGGLYFQCQCGRRSHRWPEDSPLRERARPYVEGDAE